MRQEAGQQHRKRFGQHLNVTQYIRSKLEKKEKQDQVNNLSTTFIFMKIFSSLISWSGWSGWSDGLGGPGDPGGPGWVLKGPKSAGFYRVKKVDTFQ